MPGHDERRRRRAQQGSKPQAKEQPSDRVPGLGLRHEEAEGRRGESDDEVAEHEGVYDRVEVHAHQQGANHGDRGQEQTGRERTVGEQHRTSRHALIMARRLLSAQGVCSRSTRAAARRLTGSVPLWMRRAGHHDVSGRTTSPSKGDQ